VLQHARPGEGTFLRHVTDQERGDAEALGQSHQPCAALANLRDAAGRRLEIRQEHRLDRIDDERTRLDVVEVALDDRQIVLRPQEEPVGRDPEPVGAHLHLGRRLLGGDVQHRRSRLSQRPRRLQQERALPDARVAADQHQRAAHHAAPQHAIELADAGAYAVVVLHRDVLQRARPAGRHGRPARRA
jgi:hypothetical protein